MPSRDAELEAYREVALRAWQLIRSWEHVQEDRELDLARRNGGQLERAYLAFARIEWAELESLRSALMHAVKEFPRAQPAPKRRSPK